MEMQFMIFFDLYLEYFNR